MYKFFISALILSFFLWSCSDTEDVPVTKNLSPKVNFIKTYGGSKNESAQSIIKTNDGGYIISGFTQSVDGDITNKFLDNFDALVLKYDSQDNLEWSSIYGGSDNEKASKIIQDTSGGYILVGFSSSTDGDLSSNAGANDIWVVKLNSSGSILWQKSYGFSGNDYGFSIVQTADGGYFIGGIIDVSASSGAGNDRPEVRSSKHAGGDYWGLRLDSNGNKIWRRYFGGTFTDSAYDVIETQDNGFLLVGSSDSEDVDISSNKGTYDYWIVKVNKDGDRVWEKSYGGNQIDEARSVINSSDGNFLILGDSRSNDGDVSSSNGAGDVWLIKISQDGNLIWEKSYGGSSFDAGRQIISSSVGGYLLTGNSRSLDGDLNTNNGQNDVWVIKVDENGKLEWQESFGGSDIDLSYSIAELNDQSIIIVGESSSSDNDINENKGFTDLLITKIILQ